MMILEKSRKPITPGGVTLSRQIATLSQKERDENPQPLGEGRVRALTMKMFPDSANQSRSMKSEKKITS